MQEPIFKFLIKNALFPFICLIFMFGFYQSAKDLDPIAFNYPKGIMVVLIALFVWTTVAEIKNWRGSEKGVVDKKHHLQFMKEWKKPLLSSITFFIYILLISRLGFYVSTFLFLAALFYLLGLRQPITFIINLFLILGISYMLFDVLLKLPLPTGVMF